LPYRKKKRSSANKSTGFERYCKIELSRVKKAQSAGTRSRTAKKWQECLNDRGIKTGTKNKIKVKGKK
jgi:hypothetical protein